MVELSGIQVVVVGRKVSHAPRIHPVEVSRLLTVGLNSDISVWGGGCVCACVRAIVVTFFHNKIIRS